MASVFPFPMPTKGIVIDEETATNTYAKFTAAPFQSGFGHTIGNALRRVLLSSLEGAAISAVRFDGTSHEFSTLPHVIEDVTEIILNLKKVKLNLNSDQVEDDLGNVFNHMGKRGELVGRSVETDRGDGCTLEGGEEHSAEGVADGVTESALEGSGGELGIGVRRGFFVHDDTMGHRECENRSHIEKPPELDLTGLSVRGHVGAPGDRRKQITSGTVRHGGVSGVCIRCGAPG